MPRTIDFTISAKYDAMRLDQAISLEFPEYSRARIQKNIKYKKITLNHLPASQKDKVYQGDIVTGEIENEKEIEFTPENIALNIIDEDDDILVLNKPAGLVVHPGAGNHNGTLLNALLFHYPFLERVPRAGIVHRLDKDTTGAMVVAKNIEAQFNLIKQLQERTVKRQYLALAVGEFTGNGTITGNIGRSGRDRLKMAVTPNSGKPAVTHYKIAESFPGATLLKCSLETGRTHQIRVHLDSIRHPIVGDPLYGARYRFDRGMTAEVRTITSNFHRQALHAEKLEFIHPQKNIAARFKATIANDFEQLLQTLVDLKEN